ncbi:MAG TPA: pitrilysin family protein, partial [Acidobacteriota bacterium]|nr:pitrilysin family protein [Acidobacteriota bacterium]
MKEQYIIPELSFEKYRLDNGLEVIFLEDHRLPLVAVNVWYHVGPANELPGRTGFAHLFEHMMFEGSKHVGDRAHFRYLEAAGASIINGTTDFDRTNYYETLPSNQLELALWLESDRMGFLLEKIDSHKLKTQRDVVRNERRQVVESAPYGLVQEELFRQLFPPGHPYHASVMGSHADIESARLSEVLDFFRLYYAPNNASLAVVGDIDRDHAMRLVKKYFGPIPAGRPVPRIDAETPPIDGERRETVEDQVELPRIYLAWLTAPAFTREDAEFDLMARILGGGKSSRLYQRLVYEKRLAQDIGAQQASLALGSIFAIDATCKPEVAPQQLEDAVRAEINLFRKEGPRPEELERARNIIESGVIRALEHLGGVADRLSLYNHYLGDPGYISKDLLRYRKATAVSLRKLAEKKLVREAGVTVWGVPGVKAVEDVPETVHEPEETDIDVPEIPGQEWRCAPPPKGPEHLLNLPVPKKFSLAGGLTLFLVEQRNLPLVAANVLSVSGSDRNPADLPGLASFTADMLDEGTGRRSPFAIAADADLIGAALSTGSSMDCSYVGAQALKKKVEEAFDLVADILLNPTFAQNEIERVRHDRLTQISQQKDNPAVQAIKVFFEAVYGATHPYGFTDLGSEQSNVAITRDDLTGFYRQGYVPANSALAVAGDIDEEELMRLAEKFFGSWRGHGSISAPAPVSRRKGRRVVIVDRPDAGQTVLRIGHVGAARSDPDNVSIEVMNTALGGLFSSRINLNLREKHGYTYGASSAFLFRRGPGPFLVGTSVRADVTAEAIAEIFNEIERMRAEKLSDRELALAKDSITRSLPGMFETTAEVVASLGRLYVHDLPLRYYHDLPEEIEAVTAEAVRHAAEKHLRPEEAVIVAVGDRRNIKEAIEKLGLGPVEIL